MKRYSRRGSSFTVLAESPDGPGQIWTGPKDKNLKPTLQELDAILDKHPNEGSLTINGRPVNARAARRARDGFRRWHKIARTSQGDSKQEAKAFRIIGLMSAAWAVAAGDALELKVQEALPLAKGLLKNKAGCEETMRGFTDMIESGDHFSLFERRSRLDGEILCADFCYDMKRQMRSYRRQHVKSKTHRRRRRSHKPKTGRARSSTPSKVKAKALKEGATG